MNMCSRCRKEGSRRGVEMEETKELGVIAKAPNTLQTLANEAPPVESSLSNTRALCPRKNEDFVEFDRHTNEIDAKPQA